MSFKSVFDKLKNNIKDVDLVSEKFSGLASDEERIRFCYNSFRETFRNLPPFQQIGKSAEKSRELRETGNHYFRRCEMWKAASTYTESISHAPNNSEELSLAYGNRAAALLHLNLIEEASADVERTLDMNISESFRSRMLQRRGKCKNAKGVRSVCTDCKNVNLIQRSSYFTSASPLIAAENDNTFGRSLVASHDIQVGEVLIVEKPFSRILVPPHLYTHCSRCFKRSFNLLPCPNCATSMYCSEECLELDEQSHKIECQILGILIRSEASTLELLSVRVLEDASQQGLNLYELLTNIADSDKNDNKEMCYDSGDHINIYRLVRNTGKRMISDLFQKSVTTCMIVTVLEKYSDFFSSYSEDEKENLMIAAGGLILRYLQSAACNAHEISEFRGDGYEEIGAGMYATLSLTNHSCDPNVVRHCHRDSVVLRAIRPIKKGEQLFDNYGYHYAVLSLNERQTSLAKQYYFECKCEACMKNWPQQENLPDSNPKFKAGVDLRKYELLTENFKKNVENLFKGKLGNNVILRLVDYLKFLDDFVERPWKDYNICQEAIKYYWDLQGNYFRVSKREGKT